MTAMSGNPSPLRSATPTDTGMLVSAMVPLVVRIGNAPRSPTREPEESTPSQILSRRKPVSNPPLPIIFFGAAGSPAGAWACNARVETRHPAGKRKENREIRMRRTAILWRLRVRKSIQTQRKNTALPPALKIRHRPIHLAIGHPLLQI